MAKHPQMNTPHTSSRSYYCLSDVMVHSYCHSYYIATVQRQWHEHSYRACVGPW